MTVNNIAEIIKGRVASYPKNREKYEFCFASDLMSDVLRIDSEKLILLTGLANMQSVRTAEMADISCIILARGKRASSEMIELAGDNYITVIESPYSMYHIAGLLFQHHLKPLF